MKSFALQTFLSWQSEYLYNFLYLYRGRYLSKHAGWIRSGKSTRFPSNSVLHSFRLRISEELKGQFGKGEASVGGLHKLRWQEEVGVVDLVCGTGNVNTMQIFPITVKKFLHKCQQRVGRWSILGQMWST